GTVGRPRGGGSRPSETPRHGEWYMPVRAAGPELFPEELFADSFRPQAADRVWCVLHTKPRQEKCLARQLYDARVPFYLPLLHRRLRIRGKAVTSYHPLFGGYVFLLA